MTQISKDELNVQLRQEIERIPTQETLDNFSSALNNLGDEVEELKNRPSSNKSGWYVECQTASSDKNKELVLPGFKGDIGDIVTVKFKYEHKGTATLSIDASEPGTGMIKSIVANVYQRGMLGATWVANETIQFAYDGSSFNTVDGAPSGSTAKEGLVKLDGDIELGSDERAATSKAVATVNQSVKHHTGQLSYHVWYGTCDTGAWSPTKEVICPGFELHVGIMLIVRFENNNQSLSAAKLSVDGTATTTISYMNKTGVKWGNGEVITFVYDGEYFKVASYAPLGTTDTPGLLQLATGDLMNGPSDMAASGASLSLIAKMTNRHILEDIATSEAIGHVKPDGTTITITGEGTISSAPLYRGVLDGSSVSVLESATTPGIYHVNNVMGVNDISILEVTTSRATSDTHLITQQLTTYNGTVFTRTKASTATAWPSFTNFITRTEYDTLFQSVSNGKRDIANAITGKGVTTSTTAEFATMVTNIGKIGGLKFKSQQFTASGTGTTTTEVNVTMDAGFPVEHAIIVFHDYYTSSIEKTGAVAVYSKSINVASPVVQAGGYTYNTAMRGVVLPNHLSDMGKRTRINGNQVIVQSAYYSQVAMPSQTFTFTVFAFG